MYFPAGPGADNRQLEDFGRAMQRSFQTLGINVPRDLPAFLTGNPHGDLLKMVAELLSKTRDQFHAAPDLLMFLIHGPTDRLYKMIKNVCEVQFGVASQGESSTPIPPILSHQGAGH